MTIESSSNMLKDCGSVCPLTLNLVARVGRLSRKRLPIQIHRSVPFASAVIAALLFIPVLSSQNEPKKSESKVIFNCGAKSKTPNDSHYVGSGTCRSCHGQIKETFDEGPHGKTMTERCGIPNWQNCESCHGTGKDHADTGDKPGTIFFFPTAAVKDANQRCMNCHEKLPGHEELMGGRPAKSETKCVDCHSIHSGVRAKKPK